MKRTFVLSSIAAVAAALLGWDSAHAADKLGKIDSAKKLIGREIQTTQGQKAGELKDLVIDLESGRVLYGIISAGGRGDALTAVPTAAFTSSTDARLTIDADKEKLQGAPRFTKDHEAKLGDAQYIKQAHRHFGQTMNWEGSFNNVHKASELIGMNVKNASDQNIGEVNDLGIDVPSGRVAFVILSAGGVLGAGDKLYPMPPNAFTLASDNKSIVCGIDKEKLTNAPQLRGNNWQQLADAGFAGRVYQHYGKQPYWSGSAALAPTGRDESRTYENQANPPNVPNRGGFGNDRISRDRDNTRSDNDNDGVRGRRDDNDGLRVRREANEQTARPRGGQFANVEEAKRLIGMNVENARGRDLGKLTDMVVDLESGRVIYAIVNLSGRGGAKVVVPQSLSLTGDDKALRFTGDESKFSSAPAFDRNADVSSSKFAANVYTHFGQEHNWFDASRNFGNAHKASELMNMKVENTQNQNIGHLQNLMVDLPQGRVLYVILSAAPLVGGRDHLFALPPNAVTEGPDGKTLVSDLDKAKLEGAPRFNRANLRELANPAKAAEIYRYYGKQAYWNTGEFSPTGRERGR